MVIGEITRAHGLHGEMRVTPLTDHPERFADLTECVLWDQARDAREPPDQGTRGLDGAAFGQ